MNGNATETHINKAIKYPLYIKLACSLVALSIIVYGMSILKDTLIPIAFSVLFSILLFPICRKLEQWRVPRIPAIFISLFLFVVVLAGLVYLATIQLSTFATELPQFETKLAKMMEDLLIWTEKNFHVSRSQQLVEAKKYLLNMLSESRTILLNALVNTGSLVGTLSLIPLYVFFFLLYRDFFRRFFYKLFKSMHRGRLDGLLKKIYDVIQSYLVGLVLVIGIVGVLNSVGLLILGVEYAIFFGFLAAFLILIPYIGIMIGSLLPALLSLVTEDNPWISLGVIGVMAFVQFLEGNFITPNIVGSKVSVNPLAAIIMLLLGGELWGLSGLILALPITAILKVVLDANKSTEPFGFLLGEPGQEIEEEKQEIAQSAIRKKKRKPRYKRKPEGNSGINAGKDGTGATPNA